MARIIEFITANVQVHNMAEAVEKARAMGLEPLPLSHMPSPPAFIDDVSIPIGNNGFLSFITPTDPQSQIAGLLKTRGQGVNSLTVRVDNLREIMVEWSRVGLRWSYPEPQNLLPPFTPVAGYRPEVLLMNWVRPSSFFGVTLEVFEFQGKVGRHA